MPKTSKAAFVLFQFDQLQAAMVKCSDFQCVAQKHQNHQLIKQTCMWQPQGLIAIKNMFIKHGQEKQPHGLTKGKHFHILYIYI